MADIALNCRVCGGAFVVPDGKVMFKCPACAAAHVRPHSQGDCLDWLRRANFERAGKEFEKAEADYRSVLIRHPEEHEALWGLVMCKYGVEFVIDPKTRERRATLHFLRRRPIAEDNDFRLAMSKAPESMKEQYRADAAYIGQIQQKLLSIQADGAMCDVFICYKSSALEGKGFAPEHNHAVDLYHKLKDLGYRAFFAHDSLQHVAGANYEAQIFHALHSAKVMLVVCSNPVHLTTAWVHSEWDRYLERIDAGEKCGLIPLLYDGIDPNSLPDEFIRRSLQGVRMGELNSLDKLLASMQRYLQPPEKPMMPAAPAARAVPVAAMAPAEDYGEALEGIEYSLESADWDGAARAADELRRKHSKCSRAYLYKLLARRRIYPAEKLRECTEPFEKELDWAWAVRQADPAERRELEGILQASLALRQRLEEERRAEELRRRQEQERWDGLQSAFEEAVGKEAWPEARTLAADMVAQRPDNHLGYLNDLLCEYHLSRAGQLANVMTAFEERESWSKAFTRADKQAKEQLKGWLEQSLALRRRIAEETRRQEEAKRQAEEERWQTLQQEYANAAAVGEWDRALRLANDMIRQRPGDHLGYLNDLLGYYKLFSGGKLAGCTEEFEKSSSWSNAFSLADAKKKEQMTAWLNQSLALRRRIAEEKRRAEEQRLEEERRAEEQRLEEERRKEEAARWQTLQQEYDAAARDGDWDKALQLAADMIQQRPEDHRGYLRELQGTYKLPKTAALAECTEEFEKSTAWNKALACADKGAKPQLTGWLEQSKALRRQIAEEKRLAEEKRQQEEKCRETRCLLSTRKWNEALAAAETITDETEGPLLQLMAKYQLQDEKSLARAGTAIFLQPQWERAISHAGEERRKQLDAYRRAALDYEESTELRGHILRTVVVLVLTLLLGYGLVAGQKLLPQWTGGIGMAVSVAAFGLFTVAYRDEWDWDGARVLLPVITGVMAVGVACVSIFTLLPLWAYLIIALVLALAALISSSSLEDNFAFVGLPLLWLVLYHALALVNVFFDFAWLDTAISILGWWAPAIIAVIGAIIVFIEADAEDGMKGVVSCAAVLVLLAVIPAALVLSMELVPAWAGVIAMGAAMLAYLLFAVCYTDDRSSDGEVWFIGALLLIAVVCAAIFLPAPQWVFLGAAALIVLGTLIATVTTLDSSGTVVFFVLLWLLAFLAFSLTNVFVEAAWVDTALHITGYWCGPGCMALCLLLGLCEVDCLKVIRVVLLVLLALVGLALLLALLAVPTYGVVFAQGLWPDWSGVLLLGSAILGFVLFGISYVMEKDEGKGLLIFLSLLLIAGAVCANIFFDFEQMVYVCAALALSVITLIGTIAGVDELKMLSMPLTVWVLLRGGCSVLTAHVSAAWVGVAANIIGFWLPGLVILLYAGLIVWLIGDTNLWW